MDNEQRCRLPRNISLQVTEACNLHCRMCYEWGETGIFKRSDKAKKPSVLDIELVKRVVKELAPATPLYSLFGGEPFVYKHLQQTIEAVKTAGSAIDAPTNGTKLEKHAKMLVETGFDSIRVSLDGPREINDIQRGQGSYDKAIAGIEALHNEKRRAKSDRPIVGIIYTVTSANHLAVERFFLRDLDLTTVDWITIQMQNFVTAEMGEAYSRLLRNEFALSGDRYWSSLLRSPADFSGMDTVELTRQVQAVRSRAQESGKIFTLLPPTFSAENLDAYLGARWHRMSDRYTSCAVPWRGADIMATGEVAPCHVFYDLVAGDLHRHTFEELWNGKAYRTLRAHVEKKLMPICPGCCILYLSNPTQSA
ncbi:MAG: radical SAM protein [Proteobacteria bacterium]|nr:radical SAM protein [Pseudomonadota bacterium]